MRRFRKWQIILTVFLIPILSGCSSSDRLRIESGNNVTMFIATDMHYLAKDLTDQGEAYQTYLSSGDGRQLEYSEEIVDAFSEDVIRQNPDILIISGDLTNNGEKISHLKMAEKLKNIEASADTRIFVIPGNHDINNPWARSFEGNLQIKTEYISDKEFKKIYQEFGYDEAITKDKNTLSYLAAPSEDLWLLMLDTNEYKNNEKLGFPVTSGKLTEATLEWIRTCSRMAEEKNAKIIAVMHHNLFNHNSVLHNGFTLDNNEDVYKVLLECNITLSLSGHMHIQNIKSRNKDEVTTYDVITSSLIMYPEQYGVLSFDPAYGLDYHTAEVEVETWAKNNGIKDPNLTGFEEYSKDRFLKNSYQKAINLLNKTDIYTDEEKKLMADTFSLININYFAGTTESIKEEVIASEGYELWRHSDEALFLHSYVLSVFPNIVDDNVRLFIPAEE